MLTGRYKRSGLLCTFVGIIEDEAMGVSVELMASNKLTVREVRQ